MVNQLREIRAPITCRHIHRRSRAEHSNQCQRVQRTSCKTKLTQACASRDSSASWFHGTNSDHVPLVRPAACEARYEHATSPCSRSKWSGVWLKGVDGHRRQAARACTGNKQQEPWRERCTEKAGAVSGVRERSRQKDVHQSFRWRILWSVLRHGPVGVFADSDVLLFAHCERQCAVVTACRER